VAFLALALGKPLFLEGEAGVGKTEIAKALAAALGRRLIRLQCYEGLDAASAIYEWNFAAQMIAIRTAEATGAADREMLRGSSSRATSSSSARFSKRWSRMRKARPSSSSTRSTGPTSPSRRSSSKRSRTSR
jgi:MoxR-like ATPase